MAKILDNNSISGSIQKVVETPLGYIINAHYYDKAQMIPKPLKLFPTLGDIADVSMSQKLMLNHSWIHSSKTQGDTVVTDRYDPTISYVWVMGTRASNTMRLMKIKESNGEVTLQTSISYGAIPTTYPFVRAYCGQDVNYLYYIMSATTFHDYFVKIDKITLTQTTIEDYLTYGWSNAIKENSTHIFHASKKRYGTVNIKRYNKTTALNEVFTLGAKTSTLDFGTCYSDTINVSDTEFYTFAPWHNTGTNKFAFTRYKFDTTQATLATICTEADPTITWGSITQLPVFAANLNVKYEPFITTANGKQYLNIAIYEHTISSTPANLTGYGIYTFLIDMAANTLTFKSFVQPTVDYFRGFVGVKNNSFLVCASPTACIFMNFDVANEKFVITDTLSNQPSHIGTDQSENIWIVNALGEVEYLSPFVPTNINVKYELGSYKYEGTDINTYSTINCQNYSGNYIVTNLQLTLKGNGIFTSSGSKTLTVATLSTGDLQVPIKVQGAGSLTIYPQLVL
jgi:hypothetical protein